MYSIYVHNSCVHFKYVELLSVRRKCRTFPISQRVVCGKKSANMFYGCRYLHTSFNKVNNWIRNVQTLWPCPFTKLNWFWNFSLAKPRERKKIGIVVCSKRAIVVCKQFVYIFGAVIKGRRLQSSLSAVIRNEHFCVFMFHIYTRPDTNKSQFLLLFWHL